MDYKTAVDLMMWGFGICATGFFFLVTCIWWIARQLPSAKKIADDIHEIKEALMGTMDKPGFIARLFDVIKDVKEIKDKMVDFVKRLEKLEKGD